MAEYVEQKCNVECSKNMIQDYEEGTTDDSDKGINCLF